MGETDMPLVKPPETPARVMVVPERQLSSPHQQLLMRESRISVEVLKRNGVYSAHGGEIKQITGSERQGSGIVFPYPGEQDGYARVRLMSPEYNHGQRYDSPINGGCRLYVPEGVNLATVSEIIVTEGEKKVLSLTSNVIPCIGIAGIDAWHVRDNLGNKLPALESILPRLLDMPRAAKIFLVYDSDIDRYHSRWGKSFPTLAEAMYAHGFRYIHIGSWPWMERPEPEIELPRVNKDDDHYDAALAVAKAAAKEKVAKIGGDDFIAACEDRHANPAEEVWKVCHRFPVWVPTQYKDAAEKYAQNVFSSSCGRLTTENASEVIDAAAALKTVDGDTVLQTALKDAKFPGETIKAIRRDIKNRIKDIQGRQCPLRRSESSTDAALPQTIVQAFPKAAKVLDTSFPFPSYQNKGRYDIVNGELGLQQWVSIGDGEYEEVFDPFSKRVILLVKRRRPLDIGGDNGETWDVGYYVEGEWETRQISATALFAVSPKGIEALLKAGVPVRGSNIQNMSEWFCDLRDEAIPEEKISQPLLPTGNTASRCGWHRLNSKEPALFVAGKDGIFGLRDKEDVVWSSELSTMEKQILPSLCTRGTYEAQREFIVEAMLQYPAICFGIANAVAAPLIQFAVEDNDNETNGWVLAMMPDKGQHSSSEGKTTWSQVCASIFGYPAVGSGLLQYADRTLVSMTVLCAFCSDLPTFIEEAHKLTAAGRKLDLGTEVDNLIHMISQGAERARGSKNGGGREQKRFHTVQFWTAELNLVSLLPINTGATRRIMRLSPLIRYIKTQELKEKNQTKVEYLSRNANMNYGHIGRKYLEYLVNKLQDIDGKEYITAHIRAGVEELRANLPKTDVDSKGIHEVDGRLAKRAGMARGALELLSEALGVDEATKNAFVKSFMSGWKEVLNNVSMPDIVELAIDALASYVGIHVNEFEGLREDDDKHLPQSWSGATARTDGIDTIAFVQRAFDAAMKDAGLDKDQTLSALVSAGVVIMPSQNRRGLKRVVMICNHPTPCICIRTDKFPALDDDFYSRNNIKF